MPDKYEVWAYRNENPRYFEAENHLDAAREWGEMMSWKQGSEWWQMGREAKVLVRNLEDRSLHMIQVMEREVPGITVEDISSRY